MALFGLSSFGEGLVKGLAKGATSSMQEEIKRIEDSIKSASDIRVTRIAQDQERKRQEAEKVVKALRRAKAQLGGVDDEQAAIRAASLLKQSGDLDAFNSLIDQISTRTDLDYDKYFGDVSRMSPAASDLDIAYSFVDQGSIPMEPSAADTQQIKPKGILSYVGPDIDARRLVEERTTQQMQLMDLGVRDIRNVVVPTVEFKEEAFKLDGMTAEEEFNYVNDKIAKGGLDSTKMKFYSDRAQQLAGRLGFDEQMELAVEELRVLQSSPTPDAAKIAAAEQKVSNLGKQKRRVDTLQTGSTIELLKLDKEIALENGDFEGAAAMNEKLLKSGAMTFDAYTSELNVRAMEGDEAARAKLLEIGTFNAKLKQQIGDGTKRVTVEGMDSIDKSVRTRVMRMLSQDASLKAQGIQFKTDAFGNQTLDTENIADKEDVRIAFQNAYNSAMNQVYEEYYKNEDVRKDVNFIAAYEAHKEGISVTPPVKDADKVTKFTPTEGQINTVKKYDNPEELAQIIMANASNNNAPLNIPNVLATARAAGKDDKFISRLQRTLTADMRAEGDVAAGAGAGVSKPEVEVIEEAAPFTTTSSGLEAEVRELLESGMQYNNIVRQLSKKYGTSNVGNISSTVTKVMTDIQRSSPEAVADREKAKEEFRKRQGLMSRGQ